MGKNKVFDIRDEKDVAELTKIANFKYKPATLSGKAPVLIAITSKLAHIPLAYGAYAAAKIKKGSRFEYTGTEVLASRITDKTYAYGLTGKTKMIDGLREGNELRAINHSALFYNMIPVLTPDGNSIMYMAIRDIKPGEQLLVPYGEDYDYPENLIILHPNDSYLSVEELIEKSYKSEPLNLDIKIDGGAIRGDFYATEAAARMINKPSTFSAHVSEYTSEELDLPLLEMNGDECDPLHEQPGMTPLMLMAAQGKDHIVDLLINAGVEINLVDKENNTALNYSLAHNQPRCTEKLLKALERKIDKALHGSEEDKDQQKQSLILQNRANNTLLHVAIANNANPVVIQKILSLYKKLDVDPFMYVNTKGLCPLLSAISLDNVSIVNEITDFIYQTGYTHYHTSQKNTDEDKKDEWAAYGEAFSQLSIRNIKPVLEKLAKTTNIFIHPKFVLTLLDSWLSAEVKNNLTTLPVRFHIIADVFKSMNVDGAAILQVAKKYLPKKAMEIVSSKLGARHTSSLVTLAEGAPLLTAPVLPVAKPALRSGTVSQATQLLIEAAVKKQSIERMQTKRKAEMPAVMPTVVITSALPAPIIDEAPVQAVKRLTRHSGLESLPTPVVAEKAKREKRKAETDAPTAILTPQATTADAVQSSAAFAEKKRKVIYRAKDLKNIHNPLAVWAYVRGTHNTLLKLDFFPDGVFPSLKDQDKSLRAAIDHLSKSYSQRALFLVLRSGQFYLYVDQKIATAEQQLNNFFEFYHYNKPTQEIPISRDELSLLQDQASVMIDARRALEQSNEVDMSAKPEAIQRKRKAETPPAPTVVITPVFFAPVEDSLPVPAVKRITRHSGLEVLPAPTAELETRKRKAESAAVATVAEFNIGLPPASGVVFTAVDALSIQHTAASAYMPTLVMPSAQSTDDAPVQIQKRLATARSVAQTSLIQATSADSVIRHPDKIKMTDAKSLYNPRAVWAYVTGTNKEILKLEYYPEGAYKTWKAHHRALTGAIGRIEMQFSEKGLSIVMSNHKFYLVVNPKVRTAQLQLDEFFNYYNFNKPSQEITLPQDEISKVKSNLAKQYDGTFKRETKEVVSGVQPIVIIPRKSAPMQVVDQPQTSLPAAKTLQFFPPAAAQVITPAPYKEKDSGCILM